MGVQGEQGGWQGGYADEKLWEKITELQEENAMLEEKLEVWEGVMSDYRERITSLGTVTEENDENLDQVQGELAEGIECFQKRALTLEGERREKWCIHDGAMTAQQTMIKMQQEKIMMLDT